MKSLGWLTACALALACAHERKGVVGESDTKMQGTVAGETTQPQADSTADDFAAWEQPELLSAEIRAAFKSLRPADAKVAGR
jgi:hypothetical protein